MPTVSCAGSKCSHSDLKMQNVFFFLYLKSWTNVLLWYDCLYHISRVLISASLPPLRSLNIPWLWTCIVPYKLFFSVVPLLRPFKSPFPTTKLCCFWLHSIHNFPSLPNHDILNFNAVILSLPRNTFTSMQTSNWSGLLKFSCKSQFQCFPTWTLHYHTEKLATRYTRTYKQLCMLNWRSVKPSSSERMWIIRV